MSNGSLAKGLAFSLAGGAIGAAAWAAIGYFSGYEFGILAWGVGFLAGLGMALGTMGRGGVGGGVLAAVIALGAIMAGKWYAVQFTLDDYLSKQRQEMVAAGPMPLLREQVWTEFNDNDIEYTEPGDDEEFPPEVVAEADRRWAAMSGDERSAIMREAESQFDSDLQEGRGVLGVLAFVVSFGLWGLLWVGLAVTSAYKLGSARAKEEGEEHAAAASMEKDTMLPPVSSGFALPEAKKELPRTKGFGMQPAASEDHAGLTPLDDVGADRKAA